MTDYRISIIVDGQDRGGKSLLSGIGGSLGRIGEIAGGILTAGVFRDLADQVVNFGKAAISATAQYQAMEIGISSLVAKEMLKTSQAIQVSGDLAYQFMGKVAFGAKTIDDVMPQATQAANDLMKALSDIAIASPYQVQTVQDTFRTAMAFGFASDEAKKFTEGILNVAAGSGATDERLQRMAYNLAQVRMQGKVTAVDFRQLALAGFDLNGMLQDFGKQLNIPIKDYKDFNKAIEEGKVNWTQFADMFQKYADTQFGGASKRMSRTLLGLQSTFSDVFMLSMPKVLGPAAQEITDFLNDALNKFLDFRNSGTLELWGMGLGKVVYDFIQNLKTLPAQIEEFKTRALAAFDAFKQFQVGQDLIAGLQHLHDFFITVGPQMQEIAGRVLGYLGERLGWLAGQIIPWLASEFEHITKWLADNQEYIVMWGQAFGTVIQIVTYIVSSFWPVVQTAFTNSINIILGAADFLNHFAAGDWAGAWSALQTVFSTFVTGFLAVLDQFMNWVASLIGLKWDDIKTIWSTNFDMLRIIAEDTFPKIQAAVKTFTDWVGARFEEVRLAILKVIQTISDFAYAVTHLPSMPNLSGGGQHGGSSTSSTSSYTNYPGAGIGLTSRSSGGGRASGGDVNPWNTYMVGENGPELFRPRFPGTIIPNSRINLPRRGMAAVGAGGVMQSFQIPVYATVSNDIDLLDMAYKVAKIIGKRV